MTDCGIYIIICTLTGKVYIGQSKNISHRFKHHRAYLRKNSHINRKLQNAWNKYGEKSFSFDVLEEVPEPILDEREIFYILQYDSLEKGYNLIPGGKNGYVIPEALRLERKLRPRKPSPPQELRLVSCFWCGYPFWSKSPHKKLYCEKHSFKCVHCNNRCSSNKRCNECNTVKLHCVDCGVEIIKTNNKKKYCEECAKGTKIRQDREAKRIARCYYN